MLLTFNRLVCCKYPGVLFVFLLGITYYYYNGAIDNFFAVDDYWFLMLSSGDAKSVLFGAPTLRLFGNIIFWINFKLFGLNPAGYSIASLTIHCVNVMLIFFLLRKLFSEEKLAFLSAAIYATMSVYCDAILYKAAVLTLTNLTFYCIVLILYLEGREDRRYFIWSLMVFSLALFNKEEIASMPLVILLIELIVLGEINSCWRPAVKKVLPYVVLIVAYVATMVLLSQFGILSNEQLERLSKFRIFHSLFGGFSSFFIKPNGLLTSKYQLIAFSVLILVCLIAWFVSRKRKILIFGVAWVFLTFLPQSYSNLSQFNPSYLFNSISRHLYIPSVGTAIAIAAIALYSLPGERKWLVNGVVFVLLAGLFALNAPLAHARSIEWGNSSLEMRLFLHKLKSYYPFFEKGTHIIVESPPVGRGYMTRALRAFYDHNVTYVNAESILSLDMSKITALYVVKPLEEGGMSIDKIK